MPRSESEESRMHLFPSGGETKHLVPKNLVRVNSECGLCEGGRERNKKVRAALRWPAHKTTAAIGERTPLEGSTHVDEERVGSRGREGCGRGRGQRSEVGCLGHEGGGLLAQQKRPGRDGGASDHTAAAARHLHDLDRRHATMTP